MNNLRHIFEEKNVLPLYRSVLTQYVLVLCTYVYLVFLLIYVNIQSYLLQVFWTVLLISPEHFVAKVCLYFLT